MVGKRSTTELPKNPSVYVFFKISDDSVSLSGLNLFFVLKKIPKWETKAREGSDFVQGHTVAGTRAGAELPVAYTDSLCK